MTVTPRRPADRRGERGETLVELMVTIILMGIGIAGILSGILALTKVSNQNTQDTTTNSATQTFAEALQQPYNVALPGCTVGNPVTCVSYIRCADLNSYAIYKPPGIPASYQAKVTGMKYWDGQPPSGGSLRYVDYASASCSPSQTDPTAPDYDHGLQQITLQVTSGDPAAPRTFQVLESVVVVKRNVQCPNTYNNADQGPC